MRINAVYLFVNSHLSIGRVVGPKNVSCHGTRVVRRTIQNIFLRRAGTGGLLLPFSWRVTPDLVGKDNFLCPLNGENVAGLWKISSNCAALCTVGPPYPLKVMPLTKTKAARTPRIIFTVILRRIYVSCSNELPCFELRVRFRHSNTVCLLFGNTTCHKDRKKTGSRPEALSACSYI